MKKKLICIGNGMAGIRTLEELLKIAPDRYDITVFGAEPYNNYNRILLSPLLAGEKTMQDIILNDDAWYREHNITLYKGDKIVSIDRSDKRVRSANGITAVYDRLLLATGSSALMLPLSGCRLPGVIGFRDIADVDAMLAAAQNSRHAVVIGGGLLGLEAANGLAKRGMEVTVVHLLDTLMERQLDRAAAALLQAELEKRGLKFLMGAQTAAIIGEERVAAVRFTDGSEIPADLVVMAVGIQPNIDLAQQCGLPCRRGILVADTLQTGEPSIYAVGECTEHRGVVYGLVAPLFEQAQVCAEQLASCGTARYEGSVTATKLKVTGVELFSAGDFTGNEHTENIVYQDTGRKVYKKLVVQNNRIKGVVLYGDTRDGAWYFQMLNDAADIGPLRETILFGQVYPGDSGQTASGQTAHMPDSAEICACNRVSKGVIVNAIASEGLSTLDEVRAHTRAAVSCGFCVAWIEELLADSVGDYS